MTPNLSGGGHGPARRGSKVGAGAVPRLSAPAGPDAARLTLAGPTGRVRRGAANAAGGAAAVGAVPRRQRGRPGGLATADPGPQPGGRLPGRRPGAAGREPAAVAGGGAGGVGVAAGLVAAGRA